MVEQAAEAGKTIRNIGRDFRVADFPTHIGPYKIDHSIQGHDETTSGIFLGVKMTDGRRGMLTFHSATPQAREHIDNVSQALMTISALTRNVPQLYEKKEVELEFRGETKPYPAYVMEYIEGRSLAKILKHGPLGVPSTLALLTPVAQAVDATHEAGYAHLDINSRNILRRDGSLSGALIDFDGVRKLGDVIKDVVGTRGFLAPEQFFSEEPVTGAADNWQLAAVAFHALTGTPLMPFDQNMVHLQFSQEEFNKYLYSQLQVLPESLRPVFGKALAYYPGNRYASASEFIANVKNAYEGKDAKRYQGRHRKEKPDLGKRIKEYISPKIVHLFRNRHASLEELAGDDTIDLEYRALTLEREYDASDIQGIRIDGSLYDSVTSRKRFGTTDPTLCIISSDEKDPLRWAVFVHNEADSDQPTVWYNNIPTLPSEKVSLDPVAGEHIVQGEEAKAFGGPQSPHGKSGLLVDSEGILRFSSTGDMKYKIIANPDSVILSSDEPDLVGVGD